MLVILGIIFLIIGAICDNETILGIGVFTIIVLIAFGWIPFDYYSFNVDERIELYQSQNIEIEEKIQGTVSNYLQYQNELYKNMLNSNDLETLVIAIPELNTNALIQNEIEIYKENNKKIIELKEAKINNKMYLIFMIII